MSKKESNKITDGADNWLCILGLNAKRFRKRFLGKLKRRKQKEQISKDIQGDFGGKA